MVEPADPYRRRLVFAPFKLIDEVELIEVPSSQKLPKFVTVIGPEVVELPEKIKRLAYVEPLLAQLIVHVPEPEIEPLRKMADELAPS
jgi:hypothetical protein